MSRQPIRRADPALPRPRPGRARRRRDLARSLRVRAGDGRQGGGADAIAAIGITNQRETIVFWDKKTGEPLAPAIVWQDRRSAAMCRNLARGGRGTRRAGAHRPAARSLFLGHQDRLGDGELAAAEGGRRPARHRHDRKLAGLEAYRRPPHHRRHQRLAHAADGPRQRAAGATGCSTCFAPARRAARDRRLRGQFRHHHAVRRRDPDLRPGRRPAIGDDRPGLLRQRRYQGDLRHRRLRPHQRGAHRRPPRRTACSPPCCGS
jgi:hypothetical protein